MFDLLIQNAQVLDGTGAPGFTTDVAVKDGKIAAVGKLSGEAALHGLRVIMRHYGREDAVFDPELLSRTQVLCIRVEHMTGKRCPAMG